MSKFIIETFQRGEAGYLAVATPEGALLSESGIAGDSSERRAIIGAIHSYFNHKEKTVQAPVAEKPPLADLRKAVGALFPQGSITARKVAVSQPQIEAMLRAAVEDNPEPGSLSRKTFIMTYIDADDNRTIRRVIPSAVVRSTPSGSRFPETYVVAYDVAKDEPRTFRLDRIERLEEAG